MYVYAYNFILVYVHSQLRVAPARHLLGARDEVRPCRVRLYFDNRATECYRYTGIRL